MSVMNAMLRAWWLAILVGCGDTFAVSLGSHAGPPADPSDAGSGMDVADAAQTDPDAIGEAEDPEDPEDSEPDEAEDPESDEAEDPESDEAEDPEPGEDSEADEEPDAEAEEGSAEEQERGDASP